MNQPYGRVPLSALDRGARFVDSAGRTWHKSASLGATILCEPEGNTVGSSGLAEFPADWPVRPTEDVQPHTTYVLTSGDWDEKRIDHVLYGPPGLNIHALRKEFEKNYRERLQGVRKNTDKEAKAQVIWGPFDTDNPFSLETNAFLAWLGREHQCRTTHWIEEPM